MDFLNQDIKFLTGVGPKKAEVLNKELSIYTVEDLLRHYPYRYVDRSRFYKLSEITEDMPFIQVKGKILRFEKIGEGKGQRLSAMFTDGEQTIELVRFNGIRFVTEKYKTGKMNFITGFFIGLRSNIKAKQHFEYSSHIYVIKNNKN